jgi:hypothetical protein
MKRRKARDRPYAESTENAEFAEKRRGAVTQRSRRTEHRGHREEKPKRREEKLWR